MDDDEGTMQSPPHPRILQQQPEFAALEKDVSVRVARASGKEEARKDEEGNRASLLARPDSYATLTQDR